MFINEKLEEVRKKLIVQMWSTTHVPNWSVRITPMKPYATGKYDLNQR